MKCNKCGGGTGSISGLPCCCVKGWYIMWDSQYGIEEIDEADTMKEAKYLVAEYSLAFKEGRVFTKRMS